MFDAFFPFEKPCDAGRAPIRSKFQLLDPQRPCALPTYSAHDVAHHAALAGFCVGVGHATGDKEETTIGGQ